MKEPFHGIVLISYDENNRIIENELCLGSLVQAKERAARKLGKAAYVIVFNDYNEICKVYKDSRLHYENIR